MTSAMKVFAYIARLGILCGAYFVTGKLGLMIAPVNTFATLVWPPTGISLAALLLFGYKLWPAVMLGAFLVNLLTGAPVTVAVAIALGNTLEALLGSYLLQRFVGFRPSLERLRDALGLIAFAAPASTIVSATIGVSSLWLNGLIPSSAYALTWGTWWVGDMLGDLVVAPLLLTWTTRRRSGARHGTEFRGWAERVTIALCVIGIGTWIFGGILTFEEKNLPLTYLVFPPLLWAGLRFGPRGAATATFTISSIAIWGTLAGFGPFTRDTRIESLMLLQIFMAVVTTTSLILASVVSERHLSEQLARDNAGRLKTLQETSLAVSSTLDLGSVLQILLQKIESLLPYGAISFVRLLDKETGTLKTLACSNIMEEELKENVLSGRIALRSIIGEKKTPVIVANPAADPRIPAIELFQKYNLVSYIGLPLIVKGETLGDISVFTRKERRFSEQEIEALAILVEQAAIAIYNSQLFNETKRQADELRKVNEERADFSAMIVHDLRAPLASIMGASEILQQGIFGSVNAEQEKWLGRIEAAARRLLELVRNFLDLSKLEAGRLDLVKQEVDLNGLVQNTLDFYQTLARGKDLVLRNRVDLSSPQIKADPNRLEQVLANLLSNAIKFSKQGGEIEVGASQQSTREVKLWVKDYGAGISAQEIGQLFEKYRQTTSGKNLSHEGTGLGLVICKMIVEAHGGSIWVKSEEGKETTFYFTLPVDDKHQNSQPTAA
ncbi:MAG: GAF domain-containing protein [Deltaproteobacteria bacterium]|nr:MAG: GAF domain-containing protein [Deltaproteobacteria bacterium]